MNKLITLLLLVLVSPTICAQSSDSGAKCNDGIATEVCIFNKVIKHFGGTDTVVYTLSQASINYAYRGEALTDWGYHDEAYGTRLMIRRSKIEKTDQFLAIIPTEGQAAEVYELVINPEQDVHIYKRYKEVNELAVGDYLALDQQQKPLAIGRYELKDTLVETREKTFDPETYQEVIKVTAIDQLSVKTGVWRYAAGAGEPMREENYDTRSGWSSAYGEGELCAPFNWAEIKERNYYKVRFDRISSLVRLFNYISSAQGLSEYISYDVTRHGVNYYHNGQLVAGPQLRNERTIDEVLQQQLPVGELKITYTSNEFDAFQPKGAKTRYNYYCYLPKTSGQGVAYSLSDGKLEIAAATAEGKNGAFTTVDCSGNKLITGFYRGPRSGDEGVEVINPETYEMMITLPNEFRCGSWKYYDKEDGLIKEKDFGGCD